MPRTAYVMDAIRPSAKSLRPPRRPVRRSDRVARRAARRAARGAPADAALKVAHGHAPQQVQAARLLARVEARSQRVGERHWAGHAEEASDLGRCDQRSALTPLRGAAVILAVKWSTGVPRCSTRALTVSVAPSGTRETACSALVTLPPCWPALQALPRAAHGWPELAASRWELMRPSRACAVDRSIVPGPRAPFAIQARTGRSLRPHKDRLSARRSAQCYFPSEVQARAQPPGFLIRTRCMPISRERESVTAGSSPTS